MLDYKLLKNVETCDEKKFNLNESDQYRYWLTIMRKKNSFHIEIRKWINSLWYLLKEILKMK